MPKDKKRTYCAWQAEDMQQALGAVRRGDMGINAAAASYNVPK